MQKQEFLTLVDKYLDGIATEKEEQLLINYYNSFQNSGTWNELQLGDSRLMEANLLQRLKQSIELKQTPVRKMFPFRRVAVAASIILAVGVGSYFMFINKNGRQTEIVKVPEVPVDVKAPETNRAMITLVDGRKVYLDSAGNGQLAVQGNVKLVKLANGQIAYQSETGDIVKELQYNTLSNPRGSKVIDMTLADGSQVWLNAGSSATYPVAFIGNERKVSISGEAYFEVAHDARKPFIVSKGETSVQVLGTHFNVNAYDDEENIKVTLLEGSVKVSVVNGEWSMIKPGQQAQVADKINVVSNADLDEVMAWKNGMFKFNRTDLKEIMRQIRRWYDVEVSYEPGVRQQLYNGDVSRTANISEVLKVLEYTGVKFKIDGKKIIVMK